MSILKQNLLTLDFWQDKVSYGKQTVPIGTIDCAALNITDEQITELITLCQPLANIILMLGTGNVDVSVFPKAEKCLLQMIRFLQKTEPFSFPYYFSSVEFKVSFLLHSAKPSATSPFHSCPWHRQHQKSHVPIYLSQAVSSQQRSARPEYHGGDTA